MNDAFQQFGPPLMGPCDGCGLYAETLLRLASDPTSPYLCDPCRGQAETPEDRVHREMLHRNILKTEPPPIQMTAPEKLNHL